MEDRGPWEKKERLSASSRPHGRLGASCLSIDWFGILRSLTLGILLSIATSGCVVGQTIAAEVSVVLWRGHQVVKMTGPIDAGTEQKLARQLDRVKSLPYGLPVLLLESPGGLVDEALKISSLLDRKRVHTVVPDGAKCASACASIVFIAGAARTVEYLGLLGQHSCSRGGIPDKTCNEELSNHALEHGVSYGSIAAFVTYVSPEKILWFTREEAEGYGLTKYPGEDLSGFEKSEPRVIAAITGKIPPAQSAWRINFRDDGFEAFVRPVSDEEREMQLNVFCSEKRRGRLFLSMDVTGSAEVAREAVISLSVATDKFKWADIKPIVRKRDEQVAEIVTEIPIKHLKTFLTKAARLEFAVLLKQPYQPMVAKTWINGSRKVLIFAANNCVGN